MGFYLRRRLRFFLYPKPVRNRIFHLFYLFPSLTFTLFLALLPHTVLWTLLIPAVWRTRVASNGVNITSLATSLLIVQWLERSTGEREVMGLICVGDSIWLFAMLTPTEYFIFVQFFFYVLKIYHTSFFFITYGAIDIADLAVCRTHVTM